MTARTRKPKTKKAGTVVVSALRYPTGIPGAVVECVEVAEGVIEQRNGAGSVVARLIVGPFEIEDW